MFYVSLCRKEKSPSSLVKRRRKKKNYNNNNKTTTGGASALLSYLQHQGFVCSVCALILRRWNTSEGWKRARVQFHPLQQTQTHRRLFSILQRSPLIPNAPNLESEEPVGVDHEFETLCSKGRLRHPGLDTQAGTGVSNDSKNAHGTGWLCTAAKHCWNCQ